MTLVQKTKVTASKSFIDRTHWTPRDPRPFLKWAGGKSQLLPVILGLIPRTIGTYYEPFIGGGALLFKLRPKCAVISDSNKELINCYLVVQNHVEGLIEALKTHEHTEEYFLALRAMDPKHLSDIERASRVIYLNKKCFNGLYRVNKQGQFNVPYGHNPNAMVCDEDNLRRCSDNLKNVAIVHSDFETIIRARARKGDFVYFDPPYYPLSKFSDFKRFTQESFYDVDQERLARLCYELTDKGVYVLLSNSNCSKSRKTFLGMLCEEVSAKRTINKIASRRESISELLFRNYLRDSDEWDAPKIHIGGSVVAPTLLEPPGFPEQIKFFPSTRYMGSKFRLLPKMWRVLKDYKFNTALDAFCGSGCVSYLLKAMGAEITTNDFLTFSYHTVRALIENNSTKLSQSDIDFLLKPHSKSDDFIQRTFDKIYFGPEDNRFLDLTWSRIVQLPSPIKKSLAISALCRSCLKKRPRGVFTYTGLRYDDGRRDVRLSLREHFLEACAVLNGAVFSNGRKNTASNTNALDISPCHYDLVYFDPPYFSPFSDNEYTRRYHFIEGLSRYWQGLRILDKTKTKKFERYETPFLTRQGTYTALESLFDRFSKSIIVVSYSSNCYPTKQELTAMLKNFKRDVRVEEFSHTYSFGTHKHKGKNETNYVQEYLFIAS